MLEVELLPESKSHWDDSTWKSSPVEEDPNTVPSNSLTSYVEPPEGTTESREGMEDYY
jgi:hypothetical protein